MANESRAWLAKLRLRVLAALLGLVLAALATLSLTTLPAWPVLGVALAGVVFVVNTVASRLGQSVCLHCGEDLSAKSTGAHGVVCDLCGGISERGRAGSPGEGEQRA